MRAAEVVQLVHKHRPVVVRPIVVLVQLNAVAATVMFSIALLWCLNGTAWTYWSGWLEIVKTGAALSAVAFVGSWLERH